MPGYYEPDDDYFSTVDPEHSAGFLYDAVMSIGIGACLAGSQGGIDGLSHLRGIQSSNFAGASGRVVYGESTLSNGYGVRNISSVMFAAYNLFSSGGNTSFVLTELMDPSNNSVTAMNKSTSKGWISLEDFVFADGRTVGPDLLVWADPNFLSHELQVVGFLSFTLVAAAAIASSCWIAVNRNHQVLRAAQPSFLFCVCNGALLQSFTILFSSFDESNGLTEEQLSKLCVAGPWSFMLGHILVYGGLFAKVRVASWLLLPVLLFS
jgi:hypothetical protein